MQYTVSTSAYLGYLAVISPRELGPLSRQCDEGFCNLCVALDESVVIAGHAKELFDLFDCTGTREVFDGTDLGLIRAQAFPSDNVVQVPEGGLAEVALREFQGSTRCRRTLLRSARCCGM